MSPVNTTRSSRVGRRNKPRTEPLRFKTAKAAIAYVEKHGYRIVEDISHTRGRRLNVRKGDEARTLTIQKGAGA
jgi:hypothetical protein